MQSVGLDFDLVGCGYRDVPASGSTIIKPILRLKPLLLLRDARVDCPLKQGSPTPGPQTGMGPRPVGNRATQQEVSRGQAKLHLLFPIAHITT